MVWLILSSGANNTDAACRLAEQGLRDNVGPVVQLINRFQYREATGFLNAARTTQHP